MVKIVDVNNLEGLVTIPENSIAIIGIAIIPDANELKEKEFESENEDNDLINVERNAIFERLAKQSEDELKVLN